MLRRFSALLVLATILPASVVHSQAPVTEVASSIVQPLDSTSLPDADSTAGFDSAALPKPVPFLDSIGRSRLLILPVQGASKQLVVLRQMLGDAILDQILHDTLDHGAIREAPDSLTSLDSSSADSIGRAIGARDLVWLTLGMAPDSSWQLDAQLREPFSDSARFSAVIGLPDTGELSLSRVPRLVLLSLFPRFIPPPPSLKDSVKRVAILPFLPEGTATSSHALSFVDSLARRLEGQDGFQVLPRRLRDSLLGQWDPGECLTESCRREAGERLGVPWIVSGRLTQLGDKWTVTAELVRADSSVVGRPARAQCLGAPAPSLLLVTGITARQLAGVEAPRAAYSDAPIARQPLGPAWKRITVLAVAAALGLTGVVLSW